jgi:hypothetical protein
MSKLFQKILITIVFTMGILGISSPVMAQYAAQLIYPSNAAATPLHEKFPHIGGSECENVYWDATSAYATSDGNVAYLGCLLYLTSDDGYPGNPSKIVPVTVRFKTYKRQGKRQILLDQATSDSGRDYTTYFLENDHGFLLSLFWKVAHQTGMADNLD